jgi:hypothetical protein
MSETHESPTTPEPPAQGPQYTPAEVDKILDIPPNPDEPKWGQRWKDAPGEDEDE